METATCPVCCERVQDAARACAHCGAVYHALCLERCVVPGCTPPKPSVPPVAKVSLSFSVWDLLFVIVMIAVLAVVAMPRMNAAPQARERRHCYANQKTLVGAAEMYNLDRNTKRTVLDHAFMQALKSGGYILTIPSDPGSGAGSSSNYRFTGNGNGIKCEIHGMIQ